MAEKERKTFDFVTRSEDGSSHSIGIRKGIVYTWGRTNRLGQLGRDSTNTKALKPYPATFHGEKQQAQSTSIRAVRAYAGGMSDSGHSAIVDTDGGLWMTGCDRWQQLGLGSPQGGAAGYTWVGGKIFQSTFTRNDFVPALLQQHDPTSSIRDVALGSDHSVVLSSNQKDVIVFGKGGEGQLGLKEKRFLSAPVRSRVLSSPKPESFAVCAIEHCSLTLDKRGDVLQQAGKCRATDSFARALAACQHRAAEQGLIHSSERTVRRTRVELKEI